MSFRYYLYISDAKVDMLLSQIDPGHRRGRSAEFSLNLPFVGAKHTVESPAADQVARLERVTRYLDEHADVGSVDEPGQFFRGLLPMRWGVVPATDGRALVYFGGRTGDTIVGLGGSSFHVLGAAPPAEQPAHVFGGMSTMPALLAGLVDTDDAVLAPPAGDVSLDAADTQALASVHRAGTRLRGPAQNVEFLAKRLLCGPSPYPELDGRPGMTVLLGSPLYVALVD
ncbi:DUF7019 family protein [Micromonospora tarensis]|uniref:Uncharacterized protein n=1 Tax=Micromonospora tarensis TaxID=2806100 RepID=A0ABS1YPF5_9ACTN|nr:SAVMC3_10250 family protein [Micromonospora tarensis]MBM0278986.1 hypothetical protein [Micromonospora tarensis]